MTTELQNLMDSVHKEIQPILDLWEVLEQRTGGTTVSNQLENSPEMQGNDYLKYKMPELPVHVPAEEDETEFFLQPPGNKMIGFNWGKI